MTGPVQLPQVSPGTLIFVQLFIRTNQTRLYGIIPALQRVKPNTDLQVVQQVVFLLFFRNRTADDLGNLFREITVFRILDEHCEFIPAVPAEKDGTVDPPADLPERFRYKNQCTVSFRMPAGIVRSMSIIMT